MDGQRPSGSKTPKKCNDVTICLDFFKLLTSIELDLQATHLLYDLI